MGWFFGNKKEREDEVKKIPRKKDRREYKLDEVFLLYKVDCDFGFRVYTRKGLISRLRLDEGEYRFILKKYEPVTLYDEDDEPYIENQVQPQVHYDGYDINDCLDVMQKSYDGATWEVSKICISGGSSEKEGYRFDIERYGLDRWLLFNR